MRRSTAILLLAAAVPALALGGCKALRGLGPDSRDGVGGPPPAALAPPVALPVEVDNPFLPPVYAGAGP